MCRVEIHICLSCLSAAAKVVRALPSVVRCLSYPVKEALGTLCRNTDHNITRIVRDKLKLYLEVVVDNLSCLVVADKHLTVFSILI